MNVPRDMSIWAARRLREALEVTAAIAGGNQFTQIMMISYIIISSYILRYTVFEWM